MKLSIPFHRQDTDYSCGAASLQMLLHHVHGTYPSEEHLMHRMHVSKEEGTHHDELVRVLREENLHVYVDNESSLQVIEHLIKAEFPVLVHFIEPTANEGHYAVVVGFSDSRIYLNDPWSGSGFSMSRDDFYSRWHNENHKYKRWLLVASPEIAFPSYHHPPKSS